MHGVREASEAFGPSPFLSVRATQRRIGRNRVVLAHGTRILDEVLLRHALKIRRGHGADPIHVGVEISMGGHCLEVPQLLRQAPDGILGVNKGGLNLTFGPGQLRRGDRLPLQPIHLLVDRRLHAVEGRPGSDRRLDDQEKRIPRRLVGGVDLGGQLLLDQRAIEP